MYAPKRGIFPYEFEIFKEIGDKRRPPKRFRRDLFPFERACETQEYAGRREDVERF